MPFFQTILVCSSTRTSTNHSTAQPHIIQYTKTVYSSPAIYPHTFRPIVILPPLLRPAFVGSAHTHIICANHSHTVDICSKTRLYSKRRMACRLIEKHISKAMLRKSSYTKMSDAKDGAMIWPFWRIMRMLYVLGAL